MISPLYTQPEFWMEDRSALIAYATETGNAYDSAEELARLLERIHFSTFVSQLDSLDLASNIGRIVKLGLANSCISNH